MSAGQLVSGQAASHRKEGRLEKSVSRWVGMLAGRISGSWKGWQADFCYRGQAGRPGGRKVCKHTSD